MIRLVQEFGAHTGRQIQCDGDHIRAGRAPDNDVVFDPNVDLDASGHHCELVREPSGWVVTDANSRNGTWVNGARIQRQRVFHGDLIECGRGGPRLRVELPPDDAVGDSNAPVSTATPAPVFPPPSAVPGAFGAPPLPPSVPPPAGSAVPAGSVSDVGHGSTVAMEGYSSTGVPIPALPPPGGIPMGLPMSAPGGFGAPVPPPAFAAGGTPYAGLPPLAGPGPLGVASVVGYPSGNPAGPSVGQAMTAGMPSDAHVGRRTMALMIDQALARADTRRSGGAGLKVMVGLLTVLVVGILAAGGYFLVSNEPSGSTGGTSGSHGSVANGDPSTAGARLAAAIEKNIYMLAVNNGVRDRGFCTAFAVTRDLLATNAHCVAASRREAAQGGRIIALRNKAPGTRIAVTELWSDPRFENRQYSTGGSGYDVGLARVAGSLEGTVRLADTSELYALHEGDAVFVYGFPGMTMNELSPVATITLGLINRLTDFFDQVAQPATAQKLQHSAQTSGGSSGSPIFSPTGAVVGINAGSLADEQRQIVYDPQTRSQHEVEVNLGSNFKYGMRADLIRAGIQTVGEQTP